MRGANLAPLVPRTAMQLITYNGLVAASAGATRAYFAPHLQERPDDDPERRFVSAMLLYYHAIDRGELPGPYTDADAELYARAALVVDEDFAASRYLGDEELAARYGVPIEQIVAKRDDVRAQGLAGGPERMVPTMHKRVVPEAARAAARRLDELFARDQELAIALNETQSRLLAALARLSPGLSAQALQTIYGPGAADLGLSGGRPPVLDDPSPTTALEEIADEIRRAFTAHQHREEDRRHLARDVGEAVAALVAAMDVAGFTAEEARTADVVSLAQGTYVARPQG